MRESFELFKTISFVIMLSVCFYSCGSDDGGGTTVIDGVNVKKGKKLVELGIQTESTGSGTSEYILKLKIDYDSNNRLSKVTCIDGRDLTGKRMDEIVFMKIDYDFNMVTISNGSSSTNYLFALNSKGYISQISNCSCNYDSYGYLTGVENSSEIWSLAYNEGELIKSLVNNFNRNNIEIYYLFYGEDQRTGDLLFYMNSEKEKKYGSNRILATMCFIAYQAGLFGKITNRCNYLTRSNETSAIFERNNEKNSNKFRVYCSFRFD